MLKYLKKLAGRRSASRVSATEMASRRINSASVRLRNAFRK